MKLLCQIFCLDISQWRLIRAQIVKLYRDDKSITGAEEELQLLFNLAYSPYVGASVQKLGWLYGASPEMVFWLWGQMVARVRENVIRGTRVVTGRHETSPMMAA